MLGESFTGWRGKASLGSVGQFGHITDTGFPLFSLEAEGNQSLLWCEMRFLFLFCYSASCSAESMELLLGGG